MNTRSKGTLLEKDEDIIFGRSSLTPRDSGVELSTNLSGDPDAHDVLEESCRGSNPLLIDDVTVAPRSAVEAEEPRGVNAQQDRSATELKAEIEHLRLIIEKMKLEKSLEELNRPAAPAPTPYMPSPAVHAINTFMPAPAAFAPIRLDPVVLGALPTFSGDDDVCDVKEFFAEFESLSEAMGVTERQMLMYLRQRLTGFAAQLMKGGRTISHSYYDLKNHIIAECPESSINLEQLYGRLRNKIWDRNTKTLMEYADEILLIAARRRISEGESVAIVIDNLAKLNPEIRFTCAGVHSRMALLAVLRRDQTRLFPAGGTLTKPVLVQPLLKPAAQPVTKPVAQRVATPTAVVDPRGDRCFNCQRFGHFQSLCPYDLRPVGSCFKCWKLGHDRKQCPNPSKILVPRAPKQVVAAIEAPAEQIPEVDSRDLLD